MPRVAVEDEDSDDSGGAINGNSKATHTEIDEDYALDVNQLRSQNQATLLSAIDRLRSEHIDADISIPQIVVCGNHSSGKSSVLEAIASVSFPISATTTTRFASELILRQSEKTSIEVKLIAAADRSPDLRRQIEAFRKPADVSGPQDFARVIQAAGEHLQSLEPEKKFWRDWLRTEVSGPNQPHLTLVDLPGIIQYEHEVNVATGDKEKIKELVTKYLQDRRTTVLAMVDAQNNVENMEIFGLVKLHAEDRTLGVISKPDRLVNGSDLQRETIGLAQNERLRLKLGWHVLKNLPHEEKDRTAKRRAESEREFFNKGAWSNIARRDVGVANLRKKLSYQLFNRIAKDLPDLVGEMQRKLRQCRADLKSLGPARGTVAQQREYLSDGFAQLSRLIEAALEGDYEKSEDLLDFDGAKEKGLRDQIVDHTMSFATKMRMLGQQYRVCDADIDIGVVHQSKYVPFPLSRGIQPVLTKKSSAKLKVLPRTQTPNFFYSYTIESSTDSAGKPTAFDVSLRTYCSALAAYMQRTRGKELPGTLLTKTVCAVFRQLSYPWASIAEEFGDQCYNTTCNFLALAIVHVAGPRTGEALIREYVHSTGPHGFDAKRMRLDAKLRELLWPFAKSHPMTYQPRYKGGRLEANLTSEPGRKTTREAARTGAFTDEMKSAADALDSAEVYYEISRDTFVDNIAALGVEQCLLHDLHNIFHHNLVLRMPDEKVRELAAEPPEVHEERARVQAQTTALEDVIRICRTYDTALSSSMSQPAPTEHQASGGLSAPASRSKDTNSKTSTLFADTPNRPSSTPAGFGNAPSGGFNLAGSRFNSGSFFGSGQNKTPFGQTSFGGGPTHSNSSPSQKPSTNGASPFGKSNQPYTPTQGTGGWNFVPKLVLGEASLEESDYQSLTAHDDFRDSSFEELRLDDYEAGRRTNR